MDFLKFNALEDIDGALSLVGTLWVKTDAITSVFSNLDGVCQIKVEGDFVIVEESAEEVFAKMRSAMHGTIRIEE